MMTTSRDTNVNVSSVTVGIVITTIIITIIVNVVAQYNRYDKLHCLLKIAQSVIIS
jgi:hypothetical protein